MNQSAATIRLTLLVVLFAFSAQITASLQLIPRLRLYDLFFLSVGLFLFFIPACLRPHYLNFRRIQPVLLVIWSAVTVVFSVVLSEIGLSRYISSVINFAVIIILMVLLRDRVGSLEPAAREVFFKTVLGLTVMVAVIGFANSAGLITFELSRTQLTYTGGATVGTLRRAASIFDEPAALAWFCGLGYLVSRFLDRSPVYSALFAAGIIATISLTGYALLFAIELLATRSFKRILSYVLLSVVVVGIIIAVAPSARILFELVWLRVAAGAFGEYRIMAPFVALQFAARSPIQLLFGHGVGSLATASPGFGLMETAATTHNFFVDVLFELGIVGLVLFLGFLLRFTGRNLRLIGAASSFLVVGTGYRSGRLLLLMLVVYAVRLQLQERKNAQSERK